MAAKKSVVKAAAAAAPAGGSGSSTLHVTEGEYGLSKDMNQSQMLAALAARSLQSSSALKAYSGASNAMEATDLMAEMKKAGDEVVGGDLGRVERMLMNQAMTLDAIFANLAERASRQEYMKQMETYMRLAMKAQSQCRATAEALALLKNPQPYIRQANIAQGPQQVNNSYASASAHNPIHASEIKQTLENNPSPALSTQYAQVRAGAGISSFVPSKLLKDTQ